MIAEHPVEQKALPLSLSPDSSMSSPPPPSLHRWFRLFFSIIPRNLSVKSPRRVKCYFMVIVQGNCRATRFRSACNCCAVPPFLSLSLSLSLSTVASRSCRSSTGRELKFRAICSNRWTFFRERAARESSLRQMPRWYNLQVYSKRVSSHTSRAAERASKQDVICIRARAIITRHGTAHSRDTRWWAVRWEKNLRSNGERQISVSPARMVPQFWTDL